MNCCGLRIELIISVDTACDRKRLKKYVSATPGYDAPKQLAKTQFTMSSAKPVLAGTCFVLWSSFPIAKVSRSPLEL